MKARICTLSFILVVLVGLPTPVWSQQEAAFATGVKIWFSKSAKDRRLVVKKAKFILDDSALKLTVKNHDHPLEVSYDDIQKVVFDTNTHANLHRTKGFLLGGLVGAALEARQHVTDYWCYIEYKEANGSVQPYLIDFPEKQSQNALGRFKAALGDKVAVTVFSEPEGPSEKQTLRDLKAKDTVKVDKKYHPLPELKTGKALVVAVCPPLGFSDMGKRYQYKLHANDQVIAVNEFGTYSFAYLDPGNYLLVTQLRGSASGFRMKLEAGKGYYFFQNSFLSLKGSTTTLSRQSKELVMYEVNGTYFSDWKPK